jgi:hypothetical protein
MKTIKEMDNISKVQVAEILIYAAFLIFVCIIPGHYQV